MLPPLENLSLVELIELNARISNWSIQVNAAILKKFGSDSNNQKSEETKLVFENDRRTIRWADGSVMLGSKAWLLIYVLWKSTKNRATDSKLAKIVWKDPFVRGKVIGNLITSFKEKLEKKGFPYEIESIICAQTGLRIGFRLVKRKVS